MRFFTEFGDIQIVKRSTKVETGLGAEELDHFEYIKLNRPAYVPAYFYVNLQIK